MSLGLGIYLFGALDRLNLFLVLLLVGFIVLFLLVFMAFAQSVDFTKEDKLFLKRLVIAFLVIIFLNIFVPSQKTVAAMYLIPKIVENEKVVGLGEKSLDVLDGYLDEWMKDLKGEVTDE